MKKHIVFDFDDTISSSYEHNQQLFVDTFLPHKPDIDQDYVRKVHLVNRGLSMDKQFAEVISKFDLEVPAEQLVDENELLHQERAIGVRVFDGFEDILRHFKKLGKIISLCTNREEGSLRLILEENKLEEYFDNIISCKDAGHEKPDPKCLIDLLQKYPSIKKEEVIYFGDSKTDADFAMNAGIDYLVIDHYLNKKQFYTLVLGAFAGGEDELLVEVDQNNQDIGVIYKMDAHTSPTRYHRAVSILVFNTSGQIVLQKRSALKLVDPGIWDLTGGHQAFGQTIDQTASIELMEELGIAGELRFVKTGLRQDSDQSEFYHLYYILHDGPYHYDMHEVEEVKVFDCQELLDHEYDTEYKFIDYVYERVAELKDIWLPLRQQGRLMV